MRIFIVVTSTPFRPSVPDACTCTCHVQFKPRHFYTVDDICFSRADHLDKYYLRTLSVSFSRFLPLQAVRTLESIHRYVIGALANAPVVLLRLPNTTDPRRHSNTSRNIHWTTLRFILAEQSPPGLIAWRPSTIHAANVCLTGQTGEDEPSWVWRRQWRARRRWRIHTVQRLQYTAGQI